MSHLVTGAQRTACPTSITAENLTGPEATSAIIPQTIPAALQLLSQAHNYAESLHRDVWEFALELPNLAAAGVSINDLRWLACNGHVDHGEELPASSEGRRVFRTYPGLGFTQRSCFVLTASGVQLATQLDGLKANVASTETNSPSYAAFGPRGLTEDVAVLDDEAVPFWDQDRRELRLMGALIKQFRLPSPNQETVLQAFEEEGWPTRVDDPLPPVSDIDPKRRLHDTIKSLNRHQKAKRIRFMGDGRGEGILWESLE